MRLSKLDKLAVDPAPFLQLVARRRKARIDAAAEAARARDGKG